MQKRINFTCKNYLQKQILSQKKIGFVPTMGALHQGHVSLLEKSLEENEVTVCSVYVNPAQFNNKDDLKFYPRTLEEDKNRLEQLGCDVMFAPSDDIMYPGEQAINIDVGYFGNIMEGAFRPGHFSGVAIVVVKLLNIVNPNKAYFGQKDLQQFAVLKRMAEELFFDVSLVKMPVIREKDGLAMSSRNKRLSEEQRKEAPLLYQSLLLAKANLLKGKSVKETKEEIEKSLSASKLIELEYFEVKLYYQKNHYKKMNQLPVVFQPI